jgi:YfiH family protein
VKKFSYISPDWPAPPNVHAAATLRTGGVSRAPFDELNLAKHVGDSGESVIENRRLLKAALQLPSEPYWLDQAHTDKVVEARVLSLSPPNADASVAMKAGVVCAVMTADCLPILLCSRDGSRVAAAHAGWKGLAAGILENTVGALGLPGTEVMAWLGPAISQPSFEVGDDVRIAFLAKDAGASSGFIANERGRWQCDLYALARLNLSALGVREIYGGGYCTYSESERFFSYRRDGQCGRMSTLVWLEG